MWDYGLVWALEINQTARGPEARTPLEAITSNTPNISEWLDFDFYDWCWFCQGPTHELTESKAEIGKVLGVAHHIGSNLCLDSHRYRQSDCKNYCPKGDQGGPVASTCQAQDAGF